MKTAFESWNQEISVMFAINCMSVRAKSKPQQNFKTIRGQDYKVKLWQEVEGCV